MVIFDWQIDFSKGNVPESDVSGSAGAAGWLWAWHVTSYMWHLVSCVFIYMCINLWGGGIPFSLFIRKWRFEYPLICNCYVFVFKLKFIVCGLHWSSWRQFSDHTSLIRLRVKCWNHHLNGLRYILLTYWSLCIIDDVIVKQGRETQ